MARTVISVRGLAKQYYLRTSERHNTLRDHIAHAVRAVLRRKAEASGAATFWALNDVSFNIAQGEAVGIIGRNGAGKSTLLKILSQITEPTRGAVGLRGRVASLLEVGTGFHHELTGRENIFLNGAILGMSQAEIRRRFDAIVAFAEVEKFLDTPVKHYSSGMYVRLAFAVAAHLEPEILIVDEVLAVGDAAFQKKCLGKMSEAGKSGRTILFVSHNMTAVQTLCTRTILLEKGAVVMDGTPLQVVPHYLSAVGGGARERVWNAGTNADEPVQLRRVAVVADGGEPEAPITMETPVRVEVEFANHIPEATLHITLQLVTEEGIVAFGTSSRSAGEPPALAPGVVRAACQIPGNLLNRGGYSLNILIVRDGATVVWREEQAATFEVLDAPRPAGAWLGKIAGVVRPKLPWTFGWAGPLEKNAPASGQGKS